MMMMMMVEPCIRIRVGCSCVVSVLGGLFVPRRRFFVPVMCYVCKLNLGLFGIQGGVRLV